MKTFLPLFFLAVFFMIPSSAHAADRYWVGGTGDWSDTAHWSASSGGASGVTVPTSADDVYFDVNSSAVSYTVNLLALSVSFRNFSVLAKPATGDITISGSAASANVSGAISVDVDVAAGSMLGQLVNFYGTSSVKLPVGMYLARTCYIQTGTLTFQSDLQMLVNWSSTFSLVAGAAVNANGHKLTIYSDPTTARGVYGGPTLHDLEIIGNGYVNFTGNTTLTGTLTILGIAANNRILVSSGTLGTPRTITAEKTVLSNVDFTDIIGAGNAGWGPQMYTPDVSGNGATVSTAAITATASAEVWADLTVPNWTATSNGDQRLFYAKNNLVNAHDVMFGLGTANQPYFDYYDSGGTRRVVSIGAAFSSFANNSRHLIKYTIDASTTTHTLSVYHSTDGGDNWTLLATSTTAAAAGIRNVHGGVTINGRYNSASVRLDAGALVHRVRAFNGIGGALVSDFNAGDALTDGATTINSSTTGEAWTINTSGGTPARVYAGIGDALGNSDIAFDTARTQYWYTTTTGSKTWSTAGNWFLGSGGTGGAGRVPLPQDDVVFDASSIGAASTTVNLDMPRAGNDITWTGVTNSPAFAPSVGWGLYGSLALDSAMTWTGSMTWSMKGRSALTLTTAGITVPGNVQDWTLGGSVTLQDALTFDTASSKGLSHFYGAFDANDFNVTSTYLTDGASTLTRSIDMGTGTWTITGNDTSGAGGAWVWGVTAGASVTPGTSTIKFTDATANAKSFKGGSLTYNNLWLSGAGTGNFIITGSNTFNDFKADTPNKTIIFTAGTTQTVNTWHVDGQAPDGSTVKFGQSFGTSGSSFSTPNSATIQAITGDIDVDFNVAATTWAAGTNTQIIGNYNQSSGVGGWRVLKVVANTLRLDVNVGGSLLLFTSPSISSNTNGANYRYRVKRNASTGDVTWYDSNDGTTWNVISGPTAGTAGSITTPTALFYMGAANVSGFEFPGKVYSARVYDGDRDTTGVLRVNFNPNDQTTGATWNASTTGETWTVNGNAIVAGTNEIALTSSTTASFALVKNSGPVVRSNYLNIWHSAASPASTWYAGTNSTNNNSVVTAGSGWVFTNPVGKYWVGGTGNWSDTAHWSTSSGGAGGTAVPTSTDDVYFDANSNATAYTVTVDTPAITRDIVFFAAPSSSGTVTLAGSGGLSVYGSMLMLSGMTNTMTGGLGWGATTTGKTITSNGVAWTTYWTFAGVGGGWTMQDAFNIGNNIFRLNAGAINTNNQTGQVGAIGLDGSSSVRSATFGTSVITATSGGNSWSVNNTANLTLSAASASITVSGNFSSGSANGSPVTYGSVTMNNGTINNSFTGGTFTTGSLIINGRANKTDAANTFAANVTVTGTFTVAGNSATNRVLLTSSTLGTPRTITAANVSLSNADFMDITGAGAATWTGTSLGDALGNSGITFTPSATQYWYTTTTGVKTWSTAGNWFLGSGGTGGAGRVPLPQDDVVFDASSIGAASTTVSADMPRLGRDITWTGVTNSPTYSAGTAFSSGYWIFGSVTFSSGMSISVTSYTHDLYGRGTHTITSAGKSFGGIVRLMGFGGTYSLQDTFTSAYRLQVGYSNFNSNGYGITAAGFNDNSTATGTKTINLGASTVTVTSNDIAQGFTVFALSSALTTLNAGTSTIKFTDTTAYSKTFAGGGKSYNNIWISGAGTGNFIITGSNTFNDFKADTPSKAIIFTAGTTQTVSTWHVSGQAPDGNTVKFGQVFATSGGYFSTPDSVANSITGDIDIAVRLSTDDWTPATSNRSIIGKYNAAPNVSYLFELRTTGGLLFYSSSDGSTIRSDGSSVATGFSDGTTNWIRVTRSAATGNVIFYTAADQLTVPASWTQLGSTQAGTAGGIYDGTQTLNVGAFAAGGVGDMFSGKIYRAQIYNGIAGTLAVNYDPNDQTTGATWNASTTGETWTVNGNAIVAGTNEIALTSSTTASFALVKSGGGTASGNYMNIWHSVATPASTWFATNSTDNQGVTTAGSGWAFAAPPAASQFKSGGFQLKGGGFRLK